MSEACLRCGGTGWIEYGLYSGAPCRACRRGEVRPLHCTHGGPCGSSACATMRADAADAYARGVADERARVVAWLRALTNTGRGPQAATETWPGYISDALERGEHEPSP